MSKITKSSNHQTLTAAERKSRAAKAARARWGKTATESKIENHPFYNLEPEQAILIAASNLFAEKGLKATTMTDIAAAAGVSLQGLYNAYSNKSELIAECGKFLVKLCMEYIDGVVEKNSTPETKIYGFVLAQSLMLFNKELTGRYAYQAVEGRSLANTAFAPILKPYYEKYMSIAEELDSLAGSGEGGDRFMILLSSLLGLGHLTPLGDAIEKIGTVASSIELLAENVLNIIFPGYDWKSIRKQTIFYPLEERLKKGFSPEG